MEVHQHGQLFTVQLGQLHVHGRRALPVEAGGIGEELLLLHGRKTGEWWEGGQRWRRMNRVAMASYM